MGRARGRLKILMNLQKKAAEKAKEKRIDFKSSHCPLCERRLYALIPVHYIRVRIPEAKKTVVQPKLGDIFIYCEDPGCSFNIIIPSGVLYGVGGYFSNKEELNALIEYVHRRFGGRKREGFEVYRVSLEKLPKNLRIALFNLACDIARYQAILRDSEELRGRIY